MMAKAPAALLAQEANLREVLQKNRSPGPRRPKSCQAIIRLLTSGFLREKKLYFHLSKLLLWGNLTPTERLSGVAL